MNLDITIGGETIPILVPEEIIKSAEPFFTKMDKDMDKGWQISRNWVDQPSIEQRCKVAANKILNAMEHKNKKLATMMAGYILSRMPEIREVNISTTGEIEETQLNMG